MADRRTSTRAFVGAGSSIAPERHLAEALERLMRRVRVVAVSHVYRTPPVGRPGQGDFLNAVFEIETRLPPRRLKRDVLGGIERELGRVRTGDPYGPRTIDLDLLLYGDRVADASGLKLPHGDLRRPFVAAAVLELAPELRLPGSGRALTDVLAEAGGRDAAGQVQAETTRQLRERLMR